MRILKLPLFLCGLALIFCSACTAPGDTDDASAIEASADTGADYEPMHGWPESN